MVDKTKKFLNKENHYELIKNLAIDNNLTQIAKILGCGTTCVSVFMREHGIVTKYGKTRRFVEENLDKILELNKTIYAKEIGKLFNISESYVNKLLYLNGAKPKEVADRDNIISLLEAHASSMYLEEFITAFNLNRSTVNGIAKRCGFVFSNKHRVEYRKNDIDSVILDIPLTEAARKLEIDRATLHNYVIRNGLPYIKVTPRAKLPGHVVYAYYDDTGVVRYYGEGYSEDRAYQFKSHSVSKGFNKYFSEDNPPTVEILHYGLSKDDALKIEQELVTKNLENENTIYNHPKTSRRKVDVDFNTINDMLYYDPSSPSALRWKTADKYKNHNIGDVAGSISKVSGYYSINFSKLGTFRCHVLVWLLHNKSIDTSKCVDHINGVRDDNQIENLREVTHSFNGKNRSARSNTGHKNITWNEKSKTYHVYWNENGKRYNKFFYLRDHPSKEVAFENAMMFREYKIKEGLIVIRS